MKTQAFGLAFVPVVAGLAVQTQAQCVEWRDEYPFAGSSLHTMHYWDPDGPGPQAPWLLCGGRFSRSIDGVTTRSLVGIDTVTGVYHAFGTGLWDTSFPGVRALATLPNGDLVAAGRFNMAGSMVALKIARWDGAAWHPMGGGFTNANNDQAYINDLAVLPSGDLIATGYFEVADGRPANNIARWDGQRWAAMGAGLDNGGLRLAVDPIGDLYVAGDFRQAGGVAAGGVARWNGSAWSNAGFDCAGSMTDMTVLANGELVVLGRCEDASIHGLWRRVDGQWIAIETGLSEYWGVMAIHALASGDLIAVGDFDQIGGADARAVARWNEAAGWSVIAPVESEYALQAIEGPDGSLRIYLGRAGGPYRVAKFGPGRAPRNYEYDIRQHNRVGLGSNVDLIAGASGSYPMRYHWLKDGQPLEDVAGRISGTTTARLRFSPMIGADAGVYTCIIANDCGETETVGYEFEFCAADANGDEFVDFWDYSWFVRLFESGSIAADINADGAIDFFDYLDFVRSFEQGC